jgi:Pyruvate/2-oxoacid:ferredoxin oxidoreductase delta subunit
LQVTVLDIRNRAGGALLDLPSKKMESRVLEDEISRLIRIADIHLETGAESDFNKPRKPMSKADLTILDPTGLSEHSGAPAGAVAFNPFVDEVVCGDIVAVTLPDNLKTFKAPMIAHYIAAGRLTAEKAFVCLMKRSRQGLEQPDPELFPQAGNMKDIQIGPSLTLALSVGAETKHEGTWERERALRETGRCLCCGTCNLCLQCVSSCPEACMRLDDDKTAVAVDLDFCKGCGICAHECPRVVITMEEISG